MLHEHLIPRQRIGRRLAAISLVDAIGSGMYYTGSALYFTLVVGLSAGQVGLGLSIGGAVGLLGSVPIGLLADRHRVGRVYIWLQVLRGLAFAGYCLVRTFPMFALVSAFAGLTEAALPPVGQSVVGAVVPAADRVDTLAKVRALRNVGFGLGALIATAAIGQGSSVAFLLLVAGNAASYFVIAALLARIGVGKVAVPGGTARRSFRFVPDRRYLATTGLSGLLAVHSTLLVVAVPLWFARHTRAPRVLVGIMVAINTALAALFQARLARSCTTVTGAVRAAGWSGAALAVFAVACALAHAAGSATLAIALALAAIVALTLGELWQSASGWTLSYELAQPENRTAYLSTFQLGNSLQSVVAPWVITALLFPARGGWLMFGLIVLAAGLAVRLAVPRKAIGLDSGGPATGELPAPGPLASVAADDPHPADAR
ncbi:MAG TPA: MFS transporter [Streptosporangiaceae bacterium]|jgi:MFS family permease